MRISGIRYFLSKHLYSKYSEAWKGTTHVCSLSLFSQEDKDGKPWPCPEQQVFYLEQINSGEKSKIFLFYKDVVKNFQKMLGQINSGK